MSHRASRGEGGARRGGTEPLADACRRREANVTASAMCHDGRRSTRCPPRWLKVACMTYLRATWIVGRSWRRPHARCGMRRRRSRRKRSSRATYGDQLAGPSARNRIPEVPSEKHCRGDSRIPWFARTLAPLRHARWDLSPCPLGPRLHRPVPLPHLAHHLTPLASCALSRPRVGDVPAEVSRVPTASRLRRKGLGRRDFKTLAAFRPTPPRSI